MFLAAALWTLEGKLPLLVSLPAFACVESEYDVGREGVGGKQVFTWVDWMREASEGVVLLEAAPPAMWARSQHCIDNDRGYTH